MLFESRWPYTSDQMGEASTIPKSRPTPGHQNPYLTRSFFTKGAMVSPWTKIENTTTI